MAVNQAVPWLVAYDIRDKRRLRKVYRFLCGHATPVQYSVFMMRASAGRIGRLVKDLEEIIDLHDDDVRIYRIPEPAEAVTRGRALLPSGVLVLDGAANQLLSSAGENGR